MKKPRSQDIGIFTLDADWPERSRVLTRRKFPPRSRFAGDTLLDKPFLLIMLAHTELIKGSGAHVTVFKEVATSQCCQ